jgi:hypothetical protein
MPNLFDVDSPYSPSGAENPGTFATPRPNQPNDAFGNDLPGPQNTLGSFVTNLNQAIAALRSATTRPPPAFGPTFAPQTARETPEIGLADPMGPNGRRFSEIQGTPYLSDAEREFFLGVLNQKRAQSGQPLIAIDQTGQAHELPPATSQAFGQAQALRTFAQAGVPAILSQFEQANSQGLIEGTPAFAQRQALTAAQQVNEAQGPQSLSFLTARDPNAARPTLEREALATEQGYVFDPSLASGVGGWRPGTPAELNRARSAVEISTRFRPTAGQLANALILGLQPALLIPSFVGEEAAKGAQSLGAPSVLQEAAGAAPFFALGPGGLLRRAGQAAAGGLAFAGGSEAGRAVGVPDLPVIGNPVGALAALPAAALGGALAERAPTAALGAARTFASRAVEAGFVPEGAVTRTIAPATVLGQGRLVSPTEGEALGAIAGGARKAGEEPKRGVVFGESVKSILNRANVARKPDVVAVAQSVGVDTSGKKADILARLRQYDRAQSAAPAPPPPAEAPAEAPRPPRRRPQSVPPPTPPQDLEEALAQSLAAARAKRGLPPEPAPAPSAPPAGEGTAPPLSAGAGPPVREAPASGGLDPKLEAVRQQLSEETGLPIVDIGKFIAATHLRWDEAAFNPPAAPSVAEMRTRLYNGGIDTLKRDETPLAPAQIRQRYQEARAKGIALPSSEPPSAPPDALDFALRGERQTPAGPTAAELRAREEAAAKAERELIAQSAKGMRQTQREMAGSRKAFDASLRKAVKELQAENRAHEAYVQSLLDAEAKEQLALAQQELRRAQQAAPTEDMLRAKVQEAIDKLSGLTGNKGQLRTQAEQAGEVLRYVDQKARATLDRIRDRGFIGQVAQRFRDTFTGETGSAFVNMLERQRQAFSLALQDLGADPRLANDISSTWRDAELAARYAKPHAGLAQADIPAEVQAALDRVKAPRYGQGWGGVEDFVQKYKNVMFSTDFGIIGTQVQAAVDRGGLPGVAGFANRLMEAWGLPHAELYSNEVNLTKRLRDIIDGVHVGMESSPVQFEGPGSAVSRAFDRWNRFQFGTILGNLRSMEYEGNLLILKLLGRDIRDPRVRQVAADFANTFTSSAEQALTKGRATAERIALTSPSMTRAEVSNLLQMAKLIRPGATADERILAAVAILNKFAALAIKGELINGAIGIGPVQWDPTKPGFAQVTTKWTNSDGDHIVLPLIPQSAVQRALITAAAQAQSGNFTEAALRLLQAGSGRTSVIGRGAEAIAGFGYDAEGRFHRGDLPRNAGALARTFLPIPPIIGDQLSHNAGLVPFALDIVGESNFPESARASAARLLQKDIEAGARYTNAAGQEQPFPTTWVDAQGKSHPVKTLSDLKAASPLAYEAFSQQHPDVVARVQSPDPRFQRVDEIKNEFGQKLAATDALLSRDPAAWRAQRADLRNEQRIRIDEQLHAVDTGPPRTLLDKTNQRYQTVLRFHTDPTGKVDWDAVDRAVSHWSPEEQRLLSEQRLAGETPASKRYITDLGKLEPYFKQRDEAWARIAAQNPGLAAYPNFDAFKNARILQYRQDTGVSYTVAAAAVDKLLAPIERMMSTQANAYLVQHPELVPLLDKYGYYVPASLRGLTLAGAGR